MKMIELVQEILNDPDKAIRLALFDANRHDNKNAFQSWERAEQGCTIGVLNAYREMLLSIDSDLSREIIEQIRIKLPYGNSWKARGSINEIGRGSFSVPKSNLETQTLINNDAQKLQKSLGIKELPYKCYGKGSLKNIEGGNARLEYLYKIIERYNNYPKTIDNILDMVISLERVHPYQDFNCRTFLVLILNRELIKNNYAPCIMEDPNLLDYKPLEISKKLLYEGQQNFISLYKTGLVHKKDQTNQQWYNKITIIDTKKYFHDITKGKYKILDELNSIPVDKFLKSYEEHKQKFETNDIKLEHTLILDDIISAGLNIDKLRELYSQEPEKVKWLMKCDSRIHILSQAGMPIDEIVKIYESNFEKAQWLMECSRDIYALSQAGMPIDEILKIYESNFEKAQWLMEFSREIINFKPINLFDKLLEIYEKKPEQAEMLAKNLFILLSFENSTGFGLDELREIVDKNSEQAIWILDNCLKIVDLNPIINYKDFIEIHSSNPKKAQWFITHSNDIYKSYSNGMEINKIIKIYESNFEKVQSLIEHSDEIIVNDITHIDLTGEIEKSFDFSV